MFETVNGVKVAQNKVKYIKKLIETVENTGKMSKVIIYGSALTEDCREDSDVNVVLVGDMEEYSGYQVISDILDVCMDIDIDQDITCLYYKEGSPEIKQYLDKGKVVWSVK